ncbi:hypothetical protein ACFWNN_25905 [Lentzea sp. NPDC058450]|uniref:hypothetical protein n=1 Tax=Lentzea sp. NPDC058450 TaxID=3346505 RepID=UPI0036635FC2
MLTRAVTGVIAGLVGLLATGLAGFGLVIGFCGFEKPRPWSDERCLAGDFAEYGLLLIPVVLLGGLAGTALLHAWLLRWRGQPRPLSVVAPGIGLVLVFTFFGTLTGVVGLVLVPSVAFALAGLLTGYGRNGL